MIESGRLLRPDALSMQSVPVGHPEVMSGWNILKKNQPKHSKK
jgi:hypothetical protein